ncbi:conserved hypothetical protein [Beggiatoa sp. SS]|nr:conserved hypothetical protein [Beggiatoa sp. SS]
MPNFQPTSMIGWIALAGIIVRNSILLVDYSIQEIERGSSIQDAVILACKTRTRPILITAFALVAGSFVILFDPIFQGMAISLLFGVMVSTLLTLIVIPLGCISIGPKALCASGTGESYEYLVPTSEEEAPPPPPPALPLWLRLWMAIIGLIFSVVKVIMGIIGAVKMVFYLIRAVFILIFSAFGNLGRKISSEMPGNARKATSSPPSSSPPPATPAVSPATTPETTAPPSQERAPAEAPVVTTPADKKYGWQLAWKNETETPLLDGFDLDIRKLRNHATYIQDALTYLDGIRTRWQLHFEGRRLQYESNIQIILLLLTVIASFTGVVAFITQNPEDVAFLLKGLTDNPQKITQIGHLLLIGFNLLILIFFVLPFCYFYLKSRWKRLRCWLRQF